MLSYQIGTVSDLKLGFKPALSYSKLHTFSTFIAEEKEKHAFTLFTQAT